MKLLATGLVAMFFALAALAEINEQQIEAALQRAVDSYGKVYGAWLIEKQCAYLDPGQKDQLEQDLHTIQDAIPQDPVIQNMHLMVEESAQEVAATPPFSDCGKESETLVSQALMLAHDWASLIRSGQRHVGP